MKYSEAFPINLSEILQNSETFELWFFAENSNEKRFFFESEYADFEANQRNSNISSENRNQLIAAFLSDVKKGGDIARCWIPHHGIKAIYNNQLIEIAICYMCGQCRGQISEKVVFASFPDETKSETKTIFDKFFPQLNIESR